MCEGSIKKKGPSGLLAKSYRVDLGIHLKFGRDRL